MDVDVKVKAKAFSLTVITLRTTYVVVLFQYVFMTETVAGPKQKTVHEQLAQYLKAALRPNQADQLIVSKFLKHIWFFFEILIKSMAQYLLSTDRIKVHTNCYLFVFFLFCNYFVFVDAVREKTECCSFHEQGHTCSKSLL